MEPTQFKTWNTSSVWWLGQVLIRKNRTTFFFCVISVGLPCFYYICTQISKKRMWVWSIFICVARNFPPLNGEEAGLKTSRGENHLAFQRLFRKTLFFCKRCSLRGEGEGISSQRPPKFEDNPAPQEIEVHRNLRRPPKVEASTEQSQKINILIMSSKRHNYLFRWKNCGPHLFVYEPSDLRVFHFCLNWIFKKVTKNADSTPRPLPVSAVKK